MVYRSTKIIRGAVEFESLRLRSSDYGLAVWQVLFLLAMMYWIKGIGQVLASVVRKWNGLVWASVTHWEQNFEEIRTLFGHLWKDCCGNQNEEVLI